MSPSRVTTAGIHGLHYPQGQMQAPPPVIVTEYLRVSEQMGRENGSGSPACPMGLIAASGASTRAAGSALRAGLACSAVAGDQDVADVVRCIVHFHTLFSTANIGDAVATYTKILPHYIQISTIQRTKWRKNFVRRFVKIYY